MILLYFSVIKFFNIQFLFVVQLLIFLWIKISLLNPVVHFRAAKKWALANFVVQSFQLHVQPIFMFHGLLMVSQSLAFPKLWNSYPMNSLLFFFKLFFIFPHHCEIPRLYRRPVYAWANRNIEMDGKWRSNRRAHMTNESRFITI